MLTPKTKQKLQGLVNDTINAMCEDFPEIKTLEELKEAQKFLRETLKGDMEVQANCFLPPDDDDD